MDLVEHLNILFVLALRVNVIFLGPWMALILLALNWAHGSERKALNGLHPGPQHAGSTWRAVRYGTRSLVPVPGPRRLFQKCYPFSKMIPCSKLFPPFQNCSPFSKMFPFFKMAHPLSEMFPFSKMHPKWHLGGKPPTSRLRSETIVQMARMRRTTNKMICETLE